MQAPHLTSALVPAFVAGLSLSLSLIMSLGPQNAHVIRVGLRGQHVWLTVALCVLSDALLIGVGVLGLAQLGGMSLGIQKVLVACGVVFLLLYGTQAFNRFRVGTTHIPLDCSATHATPVTRRKAVGAALAFAWLNPHAWLDTVVLIGSASVAWGQPANAVFGMGAAAGALLWFVCLGLAGRWLRHCLRSASAWRVLDGLVALMMWGTAAALGWSLLEQ